MRLSVRKKNKRKRTLRASTAGAPNVGKAVVTSTHCRYCYNGTLDPHDKHFLPNGTEVCKKCAAAQRAASPRLLQEFSEVADKFKDPGTIQEQIAYRRLVSRLERVAEDFDFFWRLLQDESPEAVGRATHVIRSTIAQIPPKVRQLAERVPSIDEKYSVLEQAAFPPELVRYIQIPKKRGKKIYRKTVALIKKFAAYRSQGMGTRMIAGKLFPDAPYEKRLRDAKGLLHTHRDKIERQSGLFGNSMTREEARLFWLEFRIKILRRKRDRESN
jgi:hypothetical protein